MQNVSLTLSCRRLPAFFHETRKIALTGFGDTKPSASASAQDVARGIPVDDITDRLFSAGANSTTSCNSGYYPDNSGTCIACSPDCAVCTSATSCTECAAGYYLNSGACSLCGLFCSVCTAASLCTTCFNGYQLQSGSCSASSSQVVASVAFTVSFSTLVYNQIQTDSSYKKNFETFFKANLFITLLKKGLHPIDATFSYS